MRGKKALAGAREVLDEYDKVVDALRAENARLWELVAELETWRHDYVRVTAKAEAR